MGVYAVLVTESSGMVVCEYDTNLRVRENVELDLSWSQAIPHCWHDEALLSVQFDLGHYETGTRSHAATSSLCCYRSCCC